MGSEYVKSKSQDNLLYCHSIYSYILHIWKGKISPSLNQSSTMPWGHVGEWMYSCAILDLSTVWRWAVSFMPWPIYPWAGAPSIHWIGDWVGPRASLDPVKKRNISCPCWESNPDSWTVHLSPSLSWLSYFRFANCSICKMLLCQVATWFSVLLHQYLFIALVEVQWSAS
jgi:hypothetical protein